MDSWMVILRCNDSSSARLLAPGVAMGMFAEFPPFSDGAVLVAWKQIPPDTHKLSKYLQNNPRFLDIYHHTSNF